MLTHWTVKNFKSIYDSGDVAAAPLTVFTGANNSGKSSFLQTILMIAQTLGSKQEERPLLQNGPIVQLGTLGDILCDFSHSQILTVEFELAFEEEKGRLLPSPEELFTQEIPLITSVRVNVNFTLPQGRDIAPTHGSGTSPIVLNSVSLMIESVSITLAPPNNKKEIFTFEIEYASEEKLDAFLKDVSLPRGFLAPPRGQPYYFGRFLIDEKPLSEDYLIAFSHFLPTRLVRKYKAGERLKDLLPAAIERLIQTEYKLDLIQLLDLVNTTQPVTEEMKKALDAWCKKEQIPVYFTGQSFRDLIIWFKDVTRSMRLTSTKRQALMKRLQKLITEQVSSPDEEGLEPFTNNRYAEQLHQAVRQITHFFTNQIRYLGPWRVDPHIAQQFASSGQYDDVGVRGEYAAAVYSAQQTRIIDWFNPYKGEFENSSLKEAVTSWIRYIGLASQIESRPAGQANFIWQVTHMTGETTRSLPSLGAGISQVLPILVMGLLAPQNSLLIVEQPELHLHPTAQARISDFFVALSRAGKQCLIETHSENLITQLRYHIVKSSKEERNNYKVYFVRQDEESATQFESIEISPRGNILNWPEGFFDITLRQEDRITLENIRNNPTIKLLLGHNSKRERETHEE